MNGDFLFSIDLEDPRDHVDDGDTYTDRVPANTRRYLELLRTHGAKATFFVVGRVAERHPALIREIAADGHEIASHTHAHVQLDRHTPATLEDDLKRCLDALHGCGIGEVHGFRAPTFSVTEDTAWVYPILAKLGFRYSSSVFPAPAVLYGWPAFGTGFRTIEGIFEMPMTLRRWPLRVPVAGGVYFRMLPYRMIEHGMRQQVRQTGVVQSYFHPYDIDEDQERFQHADLSGNRLLNVLMYVGRSKVLPRLDRLMRQFGVTTYRDYLSRGQS